MTKSLLNIGLLATTFFLCSFGAGLAIPVSLHHDNHTIITNVDNATTHDLHHDANASLTVNTTNGEIDYESEQWRDNQSDHGYKHDTMLLHPVSGRKLLRRHYRAPPARPPPAPARPPPAPARAPPARPPPAPARAPPARPPPAPARAPPARPPPAPARAPPAPARAPPAPVRRPHILPHVPAQQLVTKSKSKSSKSKISNILKAPTSSVKVASTVVAATSTTALNVKKHETATDKWLVTAEGVHAAQFCKSLGIENKPQIYNGCIEDMMVMKSKEIAKLGALTTEQFLSKETSVTASKRYCIASGDPHFTSYDRDIYHLQEEGIFVIASSDDDKFEVQERMKKNGENKPGVPACMIGAVVRFGDVAIETDVYNYGKIRVNGVVTDLAKDTTKTFGGAKVRYGKQNIAWRNQKAETTAITITGPAGFSVMIEGGYCGTLEVNVPTTYFGKMKGLCGNADGTATNADFSSPDGKIMDVRRGAKNWQMSGYGGPSSPLSKWQLAWKPVGAECLFASGCEKLSPATVPMIIHAKRTAEKKAVAHATVVTAPVPDPVPVVIKADAANPTPVIAKPVADNPTPVGVVVAKPAASTPVAAARATATIPKESVVKEIFDTLPKTNGHLEKFQTKVKSILTEMNSEQVRIETENRNNFNGASVTLKNEQVRLEASRKHMKMLYDEANRLNATIQLHYKKLIADTDYLQVLDAMRPSFLKSLGELASHVLALKTTVDQKIVKDEYKDEMITLLTGVHMNTQNISGYVATAFINHYNKYKSLLRGENVGYAEDLKRLDILANEYKIQAQKTKDLEKERLRIQDVLAKFRDSLDLSVSQREEFETLVKEIVSIFDRKPGHC